MEELPVILERELAWRLFDHLISLNDLEQGGWKSQALKKDVGMLADALKRGSNGGDLNNKTPV